MTIVKKSTKELLAKLDIQELNEMQVQSHRAITDNDQVVLLSPTGTGKTLAFLLPIIELLKPKAKGVQALILVPSRELAIQIEAVCRSIGSGHKVNAVYGGQPISKDKIDLKHHPAILIGTPGRTADHIRRGTIDTDSITTLVLDEFDKSLEVGFEKEMKEIVYELPSLKKKILTSATDNVDVPRFLRLSDPQKLNFLEGHSMQLNKVTIESPDKDKREILGKLISHVGNGSGIVFCNFRDSIQYVSEFLTAEGVDHACFYGGLEQIERERALVKFRNGTCRILLATDLAARGIDVPALDFIIHYQLPVKREEFVHRNGRTARMNKSGTAYILKWINEDLPDFITDSSIGEITPKPLPKQSQWETLFITGGRKDKISKGDIAGLFFKQGNLSKQEVGVIEIKRDCSFVAIHRSKIKQTIQKLNNSRLKKKKVRISLLD